MTSARHERRREANDIAGMRPCSDREGREGEVLGWREEGRLSIGQEARGVQEVAERGLRDEEGRSSDTHGEWHKTFAIRHEIAGLGIDSSSRRGRGRSEKRQDVSRRHSIPRSTRSILKIRDLKCPHNISHGLRRELFSL